MRISLVIPSLNGKEQIRRLIVSMQSQSVPPDEILVIDSASEDGTAQAAAEFAGVRVISIRRSEFDHGGTRDLGVASCTGDVILFMTQDALPADEHYVENLIAPFSDPQVAAVGGRQAAWPQATPDERAVRAYSYPAESRVWSAEDIETLGVRAYLISDVCSAYRREAYAAVGGFDRPVMTNEDMLIAQKLLAGGFRIAYSAQACVYHSHRLTWMQQYRRNRAVGQVLERYKDRFACKSEMGEGISMVRHVLRELLGKGDLISSIRFCWGCSARLLGNRVGRWMQRHGR